MAQITEGTEVIYPRLRDFCSLDWHFVYNPPFQFNLEWLTTQDPAPHVNPCHSEWPLFSNPFWVAYVYVCTNISLNMFEFISCVQITRYPL